MSFLEDSNSFYLGRKLPLASALAAEGEETHPFAKPLDSLTGLPPLLYRSKQLTTHAFCVGRTGSGKTGLCLDVLEEAALDGIPAIILDPKGDLTNLLLQFPDLTAADFAPWVDGGVEPQDASAQKAASVWQQGLAHWGMSGERIRAMRSRVDFALFSPGSTAATPLSLAGLFQAPSAAIRQDPDLLQSALSAAITALLGLLQIEADPLRSREFILLSNLVGRAWIRGESRNLGQLVEEVRHPSMDRLGVLSLEEFYPERERKNLALRLNQLLASPQFATWLMGAPLQIESLLYTPAGKPRMSILSLAGLTEAERMFCVTLVLNQLLSWMRQQSGSSALRALFYMDEVFGYLPPVANPPSKKPLLTLLKQARAYGVGLILATQNPVDLDYKALSNCGTWWIGRLQTEQDRARLLDGLAENLDRTGWARADWEKLLAGLPPRVFVQHCPDQTEPLLLESRHCLSYLAGPLTREQLQRLDHWWQAGGPGVISLQQAELSAAQGVEKTQSVDLDPPARGAVDPASLATAYLQDALAEQPNGFSPLPLNDLPLDDPNRRAFESGRSEDISPRTLTTSLEDSTEYRHLELPEGILPAFAPIPPQLEGNNLRYVPVFCGIYSLYFHLKDGKPDQKQELGFVFPLPEHPRGLDWESRRPILLQAREIESEPPQPGTYAPLPRSAQRVSTLRSWAKQLTDQLYHTATLTLYYSPAAKLYSDPGETEAAFRQRLQPLLRQAIDEKLNALEQKYSKRIATAEERVAQAEARVEQQKNALRADSVNTAVSIGLAALSALGLGGRRSLSHVSTAVRRATRAGTRSKAQNQAEEVLQRREEALLDLQDAFAEDTQRLRQSLESDWEEIRTVVLHPRKTDVQSEFTGILWCAQGGL